MKRHTVGKRLRAKLADIKQQLRLRLHDPIAQTGRWLKSVVQGYFNYHAVPGKLGKSMRIPFSGDLAVAACFNPPWPETSSEIGRAWRCCRTAGSRNLVFSILILGFALTPFIQERSLMR